VLAGKINCSLGCQSNFEYFPLLSYKKCRPTPNFTTKDHLGVIQLNYLCAPWSAQVNLHPRNFFEDQEKKFKLEFKRKKIIFGMLRVPIEQ
jgi:hypothetical protein